MQWTSSLPQDIVFWSRAGNARPALQADIDVDVAIIGGGMAGLTAAQCFHEQGRKVALIEKNVCGSGATGKSSGFITPDSELSLGNLFDLVGPERAGTLWELIVGGVDHIHDNIKRYGLDCDYQVQDTLVLALSPQAYKKDICKEYQLRQKLGYNTHLYDRHQVDQVIGSKHYQGGVSYPGTFGINAYRYSQSIKNVLIQAGVSIYEETPAIALDNHIIYTPSGRVHAQHIIICADHYLSGLPTMADRVYHAQTFLMLSAPLYPDQLTHLFPEKPYMVWDTESIYNYFRLTGDNRLLLGGSTIWHTFYPHEQYHKRAVIQKLSRYAAHHFGSAQITFEYMWPGLIGISKDLLPLAGPDRHMPHVYYISAATGLPWAAALGRYAAQHILQNRHDFDDLFSPYRRFAIGPRIQRVLGKPLTFALCNFLTTSSL